MDAVLSANAMQEGAARCLRKPYNMQELPSLLDSFL
jgi:hypothetical protein